MITIQEIKARVKARGSHFFDRGTMRYWGQKLESFVLSEMPDGRIQLKAEQRTGKGVHMGWTVRYFNPVKDRLEKE